MFKTFIAAVAVVLGTQGASAMTIQGEFWSAGQTLNSIDDALSVIDSSTGPDATFQSSGIDYINGSQNTTASTTTLSTFLGSDAASLSGLGDTPITQSVFRFTGFVDLMAGAQAFQVGSDDGFLLTVGGQEIGRSNNRRFGTSTFNVDAGTGPTAFSLVFYENIRNTGVNFSIDGNVVQGVDAPAPVPLPAGLPLMAAALGLMAFLRRRAA